MSMLDSFFAKGAFKASKCKTLLKLTIPRIKLLRNRKEVQLKQMRRDIAKLLETGQEATARIRVEHIIRDENMMAAQEILELFCELIAVRLPIIESQRECPLDLKEAISSICFAAPRCADLPELMQVHMSFASKYGKEFVAAATELMPDCGVNRQLVELLSVRAPPPEKKLKLLKEIAEEHELDWDPSPSEAELFKSHEDLLSGPSQFVSGSKVPLPKEKHDEISQSPSVPAGDQYDSDENFDNLDFPEVPKVAPVRPGTDLEVAPPPAPPQPSAPHPHLDHASTTQVESERNVFHQSVTESSETSTAINHETPKQFLPFISPPSLSAASLPPREESSHQSPQPLSKEESDAYSAGEESTQSPSPLSETKSGAYSAREESNRSPSPLSKTKSGAYLDLNDVLAAAKAAAESAERAAAAARSAASLAEVRISELAKGKSGESPGSDCENPFCSGDQNLSATTEKQHVEHRNGSGDYHDICTPWKYDQTFDESKSFTYDKPEEEDLKQELPPHQPQRLPSMDDDADFSYPNLFGSQRGNSFSNPDSPGDFQPKSEM